MQSSTRAHEMPTNLGSMNRVWRHFQVSHKGVHSVEALRAFQVYSKEPWIKSLGLLIVLPLPALVFLIGLELIPLASPSAGWEANYMFFVRSSGFQLIATITCSYQLLQSHLKASMSTPLLILSSVIITMVETGVLVLCGERLMFPVPFCLLVIVFIGVPAIGIVVLFTFDKQRLSDLTVYQTLVLTLKLLLAQASMLVVYPAFSAIFFRLRGTQQAAFVLVLPVIKVLMKNFIANLLISMPKDIIHTTVYCVELFNAFYVSTCMQTAVSSWSTIILISYDALNSVWSLYSIQRASKQVCEMQHRLKRHNREDLLSTVLRDLPTQLVSSDNSQVGTRKKETQDYKKNMVAPDTVKKESNTRASSKPKLATFHPSQKQTTISPLSPTPSMVSNVKTHDIPNSDSRKVTSTTQVETFEENKRLLLQQTQSLLFRCEYLASLEYVEFMVPFIYIIYMSVLFYLPNAKYHSNFRYLTEDALYSSISSIALYGGLELLSFIVLVSYIRWKFGFSPVKLLGFTIETEGFIIVARIVLFLLLVAQYPYPHYGMDPTFQFDYSDYP